MKRGSGYQQFKARALSKPEVRKAYEEGLDGLRVAVRLAELRQKRGMTQTELGAAFLGLLASARALVCLLPLLYRAAMRWPVLALAW